MAGDKTLKLNIWIAGKMEKSLTAAINSANGQISSLSTNLSRVGTVGLAAMGVLATGTVLALGKCVKEAESFEKSMADVTKYVDGLADSTGKISGNVWDAASGGNGKTFAANYDEMSEALLDLTTQIPMTAEDLTRLAAAAGESGKSMKDLIAYDANGNVAGFIKDIAMVGTAMDITADQAGDWAAKWEKSLSMTHDEVMVLFDQINYMGANSATTAAEIADVVNSVASLGQVAGMDAASTAAMADAMLAMGVETDVASTSISRMMVNMSKGESATKKQKVAWEQLGFTASGVAKAMQTDAPGTMLDVLTAIDNMDADKQVAALNTLFGQWAIKGAAKMTGNLSVFTDALKMIADPSLYEGSMEREFIIKADTAAAIDMRMGNAKKALAIDFGTAFLPAKKEFSMMMIDVMNGLRKNMPELSKLATSAARLLSNGISAAGTALQNAMPYIQQALDYLVNNGDKVIKVIKGIGLAFLGMKLAPQIEKTIKGVGMIVKTLSAVKMGVGIATTAPEATGIAGILETADNGLVGAIIGLKNTMKLTNSKISENAWMKNLSSVAENITVAKESGGVLGMAKNAAMGAVSAALPVAGVAGALTGGVALINAVTDVYDGYKATQAGDEKAAKTSYMSAGTKGGLVLGGTAAGAAIGSVVPIVGTAVGAGIGAGVGGIAALMQGGNIGQALSDATDEGGWISNAAEAVGHFFTTTIPSAVGNLFDALGTFFTQNVPQFFTQTVPKFFSDMLTGVGEFFTQTVPYALGFVVGVGEVFFSTTLPNFFKNMFDGIGMFFTTTLPAWIGGIWNDGIVPFFTITFPNFFKNMFDGIGTFFTTTLPAWIGGIWNDGIVPFFTTTLPGFIKGVFNGVCNFFTEDLPNIISGIWDGIKGLFSGIGDWFRGIIEGVKNSFSAGRAAGTGTAGGAATIPRKANGGFTDGISIAGEAGTEAVISFRRGVRGNNIETWMQAGQMLGVSGQQAAIAAGITNIRYFADGGCTATGLPLTEAQEDNSIKLDEIERGDPSGSRNYHGGENITFSPQITILGNADTNVMEQAVADMRSQFEAWYEQMQRRKVRTAY